MTPHFYGIMALALFGFIANTVVLWQEEKAERSEVAE
jgi:hypothetical protein